MQLFDSLVHITEDGKWFNTSHDCSIDKLMEYKESFNKALLVGMPYMANNKYTLNVSRQFEDKFVPIYGLEMKGKSSKELIGELRIIKSQGYKGIKIHPRLCQIEWIDEIIIDVINEAGSIGLIVLFCTVYGVPLNPLKRPVYDVLYEICIKTNGAKIILLHGGYTEILQTSEIVRPFENILIDLSYTLVRFKNSSIINDIAYLFTNFDRRICVGSDFPEHNHNDLMEAIFEKALPRNDCFDMESIKYILYDNLSNYIE